MYFHKTLHISLTLHRMQGRVSIKAWSSNFTKAFFFSFESVWSVSMHAMQGRIRLGSQILGLIFFPLLLCSIQECLIFYAGFFLLNWNIFTCFLSVEWHKFQAISLLRSASCIPLSKHSIYQISWAIFSCLTCSLSLSMHRMCPSS